LCGTFSSRLTFETFASADMKSWSSYLGKMLKQSAVLICSSPLLSPGWLSRILRLWRCNLHVCVWGNMLESQRYWYIPTALTFAPQEKKRKKSTKEKKKKISVVSAVGMFFSSFSSGLTFEHLDLSNFSNAACSTAKVYVHIYIYTHIQYIFLMFLSPLTFDTDFWASWPLQFLQRCL